MPSQPSNAYIWLAFLSFILFATAVAIYQGYIPPPSGVTYQTFAFGGVLSAVGSGVAYYYD